MEKYNKEIEEFKKSAQSEYFKMQQEEDKNRRKFYYTWIVIMFFLPILIVAFRYFERFSSSSKNEARYHEEVSEINSFADGLLLDSEFLASLDFQNGTAKVYLEDLYASFKLTKPYYDLKYTHQCLGYFLVVKENDLYRIYTTDYCKM